MATPRRPVLTVTTPAHGGTLTLHFYGAHEAHDKEPPMTTTSAPATFPLGATVLMGGSVATVTGTGTLHRRGVPTPVVVVRCPDYTDGSIRLAGNAIYALAPWDGADAVHVVVSLNPGAFGLPAHSDVPGPTFAFDLVTTATAREVCDTVYGITNSYPGEMFCDPEHAPIVEAYRSQRLRSLSVGDTIAITRDGNTTRFRVARFGFTPITEGDTP
jgi:hypothetical protein